MCAGACRIRWQYLASVVLMAGALTACGGLVTFDVHDTFKQQLAGFTPGVTTRQQVRAVLGEPFYTNAQWGIEAYEGSETGDSWLFASGLLLPLGSYDKPTGIFLVFSAQGILRGGRDLQGAHRAFGDLNGLSSHGGVIVAYSEASKRAQSQPGARDACTMVAVVASQPAAGDMSQLYLDGWFLQRALNGSFFRLSVPPGSHELSCTTARAHGGWSFDEPEGTTLPLPQPGHNIDESPADAANTFGFNCAAGDTRYFSLEHDTKMSFLGRKSCSVHALEPADGQRLAAFASLVIVPDQSLEKIHGKGPAP